MPGCASYEPRTRAGWADGLPGSGGYRARQADRRARARGGRARTGRPLESGWRAVAHPDSWRSKCPQVAAGMASLGAAAECFADARAAGQHMSRPGSPPGGSQAVSIAVWIALGLVGGGLAGWLW